MNNVLDLGDFSIIAAHGAKEVFKLREKKIEPSQLTSSIGRANYSQNNS